MFSSPHCPQPLVITNPLHTPLLPLYFVSLQNSLPPASWAFLEGGNSLFSIRQLWHFTVTPYMGLSCWSIHNCLKILVTFPCLCHTGQNRDFILISFFVPEGKSPCWAICKIVSDPYCFCQRQPFPSFPSQKLSFWKEVLYRNFSDHKHCQHKFL